MSFTFTNQMEENVKMQLQFPFHMNNDKLQQKPPVPYPKEQKTSSYDKLLWKAYREPFAVYLTDEDRQYYSAQELELFDKVIALEQERLNNGMCLIDLNLDQDVFDVILEYKTKNHMTFEEAIIDLLKKCIEEQKGDTEEEFVYPEKH